MHLSKLILNRHSRQVQTDLTHPYELHRTLARAFETPEGTSYRRHHGVLFRVEERPEPSVLVQSHSEPDWTCLPEGYASQVQGPRTFEPMLAIGDTLRFRLVANPTKTVVRDGKKRHLGLFRSETIPGDVQDDTLPTYWQWLDRQAEKSGFIVLDGALDAPFRTAGPRNQNGHAERPKSRVPFFGVRFDGYLRVTDPDALLKAIRDGIGRSKAFGFGLLSLAR